jgi:hypothetical protein
MNFKPLLLPVFLGIGLCSIYFLPQAGGVADSAIIMELPAHLGAWSLSPTPATKMEIETLGADTKFSKADCRAYRPDAYDNEGYPLVDTVNLSIVLSGYDLNSSIHRPERCMPAQGHTILGSKDVKIALSNNYEFDAKRLISIRRGTSEESNAPAEYKCITYYFFIGHDHVTNDHLERTFIDMKDRLIRGMDQRWAYVSASIYYGKLPWVRAKEVSEEEADVTLKKFITALAGKQIDWDQIAR